MQCSPIYYPMISNKILNEKFNRKININIFTKMRNYSIVWWFPLPKVLSVLLAINSIWITKHRCFLIRGIWSSICKRHSLRTDYNSKTEWVPCQRQLCHKSTGWFPTVNQYCSQQLAWPSNCPCAQRSHPVCKIMTLPCCSVFFCCRKLTNENPIIIIEKNWWYESNHNSNNCNI